MIARKQYIKPNIIEIHLDSTIRLICLSGNEDNPPPYPANNNSSNEKHLSKTPFRQQMFEDNPLETWNQ